MASEALLLLLELNLAGGAAILVVLALRTAMRSWFGARVAYALWLAVPVAVGSTMLPTREIAVGAAPAAPAVISPVSATGEWLVAALPIGARLDPSPLIMATWLAGVILALAVLGWRQAAFTRSLGRLHREAKGVLRAEAAGIGPAIIGALRPQLVLPNDFEARFDNVERNIVLAHERIHLQGRDPLVNAAVALAQCVCWFNPLVHLAGRLLRVDQELACDAAVIAQFPLARRSYAQAMLKTQFAPMSLPLGCYWPSGGAHPLKQRIAMLKRGLPSKHRLFAGAIVAVAACLSTGCIVWVVQPPREVEARINPVSPAQATLNASLLRAVWSGNFARAEKAIASGADANVRTADGMTALIVTARKEDMRMLNLLLEHGADPNLASRGEGNALVAAARRGHLHAVVALVEHGAEINRIGPGVGTPLAASARSGEAAVVKYLVEHGANVNLASPLPAPWDLFGPERKPLQVAIDADNRSVAEYLRSVGATM